MEAAQADGASAEAPGLICTNRKAKESVTTRATSVYKSNAFLVDCEVLDSVININSNAKFVFYCYFFSFPRIFAIESVALSDGGRGIAQPGLVVLVIHHVFLVASKCLPCVAARQPPQPQSLPWILNPVPFVLSVAITPPSRFLLLTHAASLPSPPLTLCAFDSLSLGRCTWSRACR